MKSIVYATLLGLFLASSFALHAQSGWVWARSAAGGSTDEVHEVTVDTGDHSFIPGSYSSDTLLFGTNMSLNQRTNLFLATYDIFVAKCSPQGNLLWALNFGGGEDEKASGIEADGVGNCYVTGTIYPPSATFDVITVPVSGTDGNVVLVKYDNNGNVVWASSADGIGNDQGFGIEMSTTGDLYLTGFFGGPSVGFAPADRLTSSTIGSEIFVARTGEGKTGIFSAEVAHAVTVYPNPSGGIFYFDCAGLSFGSFIEIYDANGRLIQRTAIKQPRTMVNLSTYTSGLFFRSISDGDIRESGSMIIE